ncbi:hypothetical protein B0J14DRAFT_571074 [Halenospora varia]|nr:hypothetical protein B0J14DRAFT_571074 [Halenospora varia]
MTRYKVRISSLQRENGLLKDANRKLEFKYHDVKQDIGEVERSYASIKAQKDGLKAELDKINLELLRILVYRARARNTVVKSKLRDPIDIRAITSLAPSPW